MGIDFFATNHNHRDATHPDHPATIHLDVEDPWSLSWNVGNAEAMWKLLGLPLEGGGVPQHGEVSVPEARRAVTLARARFERVPNVVRAAEIEHGPPRALEDGTVELRPIRWLSVGLNREGVERRLVAFARFVEAMAELGATHIAWS